MLVMILVKQVKHLLHTRDAREIVVDCDALRVAAKRGSAWLPKSAVAAGTKLDEHAVGVAAEPLLRYVCLRAG